MERRELPGNDASWYRALLVEQNDEPETEIPAGVPPVALVDEVAAEEATPDHVVQPPTLTGDTEPIPFPDEIDDDSPTDMLDSTSAESDVEPTSDETEPTEESSDERSEALSDSDGPPEEPADERSDPPADSDEQTDGDAAAEAVTDTEADDTSAPAIAPVPEPESEEGAIDNTSEMVGQLWTSQAPASPLDDWAPDEMNNKIKSSRPFRWTTVVGVLAVLGLIAVGLVLLPSLAENRADSHREMMTAALWDLRSELPDTQMSLETATEPTASVTTLSDLSTQLTVLSAKASEVDEAGRSDLPTAPPFTSSSPIDDLVPIQQRLEPLATTAQTIQRRIANLVEYRSLMSGFLDIPDLPGEADSATQADLRVVLASAQAESASILADLPGDVSLSEHQAVARSINELFASWQIDYLEALRTLDAATAQTLVADLNTRLTDLDSALITPLAQIRRQTDADLIDLARAIDEVMDLARDTASAP